MYIVMIVSTLFIFIFIFMVTWGDYHGSDAVAIASMIGCIVFFAISLTFNIGFLVSKNKAKFYNAVYKTNYTTEDVFWNDEIIRESIIGKKNNVNLKVESGEAKYGKKI